MFIKYFRGCSAQQAEQIFENVAKGKLNSAKGYLYWTDNFDQAEMYAKRYSAGVVVEVVMDEQPRGIYNYFSVGLGDSYKTNIREWKLRDEYFNQHFSTVVEEVFLHAV